MQRIEYRTIDKSQWGEGPWQDEPDKIQWQDEETGLPCLIVRGHMGFLCGYVGVGPDHPGYGLNYDGDNRPKSKMEIDDDGQIVITKPPLTEPLRECLQIREVEVHGDLTYAAGCDGGLECRSICHVPAAGEPDHAWWFGFDCGHCDDRAPGMLADMKSWRPAEEYEKYESLCGGDYRDIQYVTSECQKLAKQLKAMEK